MDLVEVLVFLVDPEQLLVYGDKVRNKYCVGLVLCSGFWVKIRGCEIKISAQLVTVKQFESYTINCKELGILTEGPPVKSTYGVTR